MNLPKTTPALIRLALRSDDWLCRVFAKEARDLYAEGFKASARAKVLAALKPLR